MLAAAPADPGMDDWLDALAQCREQLAPRSQRALELAYRDGIGRAAIATELGIAANTVRNLLARTRDTLKQCIETRMSKETDR